MRVCSEILSQTSWLQRPDERSFFWPLSRGVSPCRSAHPSMTQPPLPAFSGVRFSRCPLLGGVEEASRGAFPELDKSAVLQSYPRMSPSELGLGENIAVAISGYFYDTNTT